MTSHVDQLRALFLLGVLVGTIGVLAIQRIARGFRLPVPGEVYVSHSDSGAIVVRIVDASTWKIDCKDIDGDAVGPTVHSMQPATFRWIYELTATDRRPEHSSK